MKDYSQFGEGKIIFEAVQKIESLGFYVPKIAVEFGSGDGYELSNIRGLMEDGWQGFQLDSNPLNAEVFCQKITTANINSTIPEPCSVLSIDVDGNDFWLWKALNSKPWIVVIEFNQTLSGRKTIPYDPEHRWAGDDYFGASFQAMLDLGRNKGYKAVAKTLCNLIFILADVWPDPEPELTHQPNPSGWTISGRDFQEV